ncbi:MAG TPA: hypothetical protein VI454_11715, partial [Verrucomicrobiae bacterium]
MSDHNAIRAAGALDKDDNQNSLSPGTPAKLAEGSVRSRSKLWLSIVGLLIAGGIAWAVLHRP